MLSRLPMIRLSRSPFSTLSKFRSPPSPPLSSSSSSLLLSFIPSSSSRSLFTSSHFSPSSIPPRVYPLVKWGSALSVGCFTYYFLEPFLWLTISALTCIGTARWLDRWYYQRSTIPPMFEFYETGFPNENSNGTQHDPPKSNNTSHSSSFQETHDSTQYYTLYQMDEFGRMKPIKVFKSKPRR